MPGAPCSAGGRGGLRSLVIFAALFVDKLGAGANGSTRPPNELTSPQALGTPAPTVSFHCDDRCLQRFSLCKQPAGVGAAHWVSAPHSVWEEAETPTAPVGASTGPRGQRMV